MVAALNIENLHKSYAKLKAVNGVNLRIEAGQSVAFIGPNGAGKSTTMRCIAGLCVPDEGSIQIAGYDNQSQPVLARAQLGYVSQDLELYHYLTGLELLQFIARVRGMEQKLADERIAELLALCGLEEAKNRLIREYSGGMARKLAMAQALLPPTSLVVLDESFVGLDPESTYQFHRYLKRYTEQGGAILVSSHILEMLQGLCTRFFFLHHGQCVADLSSQELAVQCSMPEHPNITALYLHLTGQSALLQEQTPPHGS